MSLKNILLALATGFLLALSWPTSGFSPLSFIGFVPLLLAEFDIRKDNFKRKVETNEGTKNFNCINGQLIFSKKEYAVKFSDIFFVKVGGVSGLDSIFSHQKGNMNFVCSTTHKNKKTKKMFYNTKNQYLREHKEKLLSRKIKSFNEDNWWCWGRDFYNSNEKRIYVNCKTRSSDPFFTHRCKNYDGSVLAIFPKNQKLSIQKLCKMLNEVDWNDLGFMCGNRYIFSQRSLENTILPKEFASQL